MNNMICAVQKKIFQFIQFSSKRIQQNSYVIGGYVRDFLLRKEKIENLGDLDILTIGEGIRLAKEVSREIKFHNNRIDNPRIRIFKRYGTAMLEYENQKIEFVGSRKESYRNDSRNPFVEKGSLQDDQNRRDFTINTLAISLNEKDYGELIDPFGGLSDLKNKIIKTPLNSDITYSDDPLRMMRAIRLATQLNFSIDPSSFQSIQKNKDRINIVSKERILEEFNKILLCEKPSLGLLLMYKSGLLNIILPELTLLEKTEERNGFKYKNNFYHTLQVVDNLSIRKINSSFSSLWLRWSALLHDIGKPYTKNFSCQTGWSFHDHEYVGSKIIPKIFHRLKLPKGKIMKYVIKIIQYSCRPISLIGPKVSDSAVRRLLFDSGKDLEDLIELCLADITTNNIKKRTQYRNNIFFLLKRIKKLKEKDRIINWKSPISGNDIMNTFFIHPCKKIGIIKNYIKDSILDGKIENDFNSAYRMMLKKGNDLGLKKRKKS